MTTRNDYPRCGQELVYVTSDGKKTAMGVCDLATAHDGPHSDRKVGWTFTTDGSTRRRHA